MHGKTAKILELHEQGHTYAEIARMMECSKPNVAQTVKRHREWNRMVAPIPIEQHEWVVKQAHKNRMLPPIFVAKLLSGVIAKELKNGK